MALISLSDFAPAEAKHFSLGNAEFDITASGYETTDPRVLADALAHPWLDVKYPEVKTVATDYVGQVRPEDDRLSSMNDHSNDPEVAAKAEADKQTSTINPVAIDAGEDQGEVIDQGGVAETLSAAAVSDEVAVEGTPIVTAPDAPKVTTTAKAKTSEGDKS
jgi:hypothetical protein